MEHTGDALNRGEDSASAAKHAWVKDNTAALKGLGSTQYSSRLQLIHPSSERNLAAWLLVHYQAMDIEVKRKTNFLIEGRDFDLPLLLTYMKDICK